MSFLRQSSVERGFSLIEVLIALIIATVGLLGVAKMQALVLSNTGTSRLRTLIALQTQSLAAAIHANRDYWSGAPNGLNVTINTSATGSPTIQDNSGVAGTLATAFNTELAAVTGNSADCQYGGALGTALGASAPCDPVYLAGYDLAQWGLAMGTAAGTTQTIIDCAQNAQNNNIIDCTVTVKWTENTVNADSEESSQATAVGNAFKTQTYKTVVQP